MHPYGRHINSNLGYVICSSYITMLFYFVKPNALVKTHILTVLCDIFVLVNVLVIKPLLCMHMDNISTLTSDMTSVVHAATYYDRLGQRVSSVF